MPCTAAKFGKLITLLYFLFILNSIRAKEHIIQTNVKLDRKKEPSDNAHTKIGEDNIPVIEIKGEGKPMTAAQIRALEEEAEGKPLDIKVKKIWQPDECPVKAKRLDFVTFHYKGFLEDGKKFDHTYGRDPITIQLGVGMTLPGLDKGLRGACDTERRKITIPWRLARRKKSKMWKNIPKEEHWITLEVEIFRVDPWSPKTQFEHFDLNKDSFLTAAEMVRFAEKMRNDYGKAWPNADIDNVIAANYFIRYFDVNIDQKVSFDEYGLKMKEDQIKMHSSQRRSDTARISRKRDPGLAWILDFNNDGEVTREEMDKAPDLLEKGPEAARKWVEEAKRNLTKVKTEL